MLEERIQSLIQPLLLPENLDVVKVSVNGASKGKILQILLENADGSTPTLGSCAKASRSIAALLDVEDVFSDRYYLEVSSAGLERPLVKPRDFKRFEGFLVKAKLKFLDDTHNTKKFMGRIKSSSDANFTIFDDEKDAEIEIDYFNLDDAKIVATDELFKSKGASN